MQFDTQPIDYSEAVSLNTSASEYAEAVQRIARTIESKENRERAQQHVINKLQEIYALQGTISKYFVEKGITNVSIYCDPEDAVLGKMMCKDFQVNHEVNVLRFIAGRNYTLGHEGWTHTPPEKFNELTEDELESGLSEKILVVSSGKDIQARTVLNKLEAAQKGRVLYLVDMLKNISWHYQLYKPVLEFVASHPNNPVITFIIPYYPTKETRNENEKWMADNDFNRFAILKSLHSDTPIIPKAYDGYGFNANDIIELMATYPQYAMGDGTVRLQDRRGKLVNIVEGQRVTTDIPDDYGRTVYVIGGCTIFGFGAQDSETLPSWLQRILNEQAPEARLAVSNRGVFAGKRRILTINALRTLNCAPGDIIFIQVPKVPGVPDYNFSRLFERPHNFGEVFIDFPTDTITSHHSQQGQRALALQFFEVLKERNLLAEPDPETFASTTQKQTVAPSRRVTDPVLARELDAYKASLLKVKKTSEGTVGSIVMNCNPFTLGHRYLIEYAAGQVDQLYIFVVQEDKSFFPFADRLKLVEEGVKDLPNVTVVPSGKFIISSITFSDYFAKQELKDRTIDSSNDVSLFAEEIAPVLDITVRFVGEEPLCNVTRQYNSTMKRILPQYDIDLVIIPRKESGGEPISASRVRALLDDKDFDAIGKIVPPTTLEYLINRFS